ncbi:hypothetical protein EJJ20_20720 [Pseudomonas poae]|nr:hypothetical protein EJJ20_20720 [Pseudomonas poae]
MQEFCPQPGHSTVRPPLKIKSELDRSRLKMTLRLTPLLIGFVASQKLALGGEFYIGEILALIYLAINLGSLKLEKSTTALIAFGIIWATCQFISDQVNQSDAVDSLKGVGAPLIFLSTFIALSIYFDRDNRRMPSFLIGAYLGAIPQFILFPSEYFLGNAWKWGIGQLVIALFATVYTFFIARKKTPTSSCSSVFFPSSVFLMIRGAWPFFRSSPWPPTYCSVANVSQQHSIQLKDNLPQLKWFF